MCTVARDLQTASQDISLSPVISRHGHLICCTALLKLFTYGPCENFWYFGHTKNPDDDDDDDDRRSRHTAAIDPLPPYVGRCAVVTQSLRICVGACVNASVGTAELWRNSHSSYLLFIQWHHDGWRVMTMTSSQKWSGLMNCSVKKTADKEPNVYKHTAPRVMSYIYPTNYGIVNCRTRTADSPSWADERMRSHRRHNSTRHDKCSVSKFPGGSVGSRRELVGNLIHTARQVKTPTRRDETVACRWCELGFTVNVHRRSNQTAARSPVTVSCRPTCIIPTYILYTLHA